MLFLQPGGDIYCENREHHHSEGRKKNREQLSDTGHGVNIRTNCGYVHKCPPEGVPVLFYHTVYRFFLHIEDQAGKIDKSRKNGEIGDEKT